MTPRIWLGTLLLAGSALQAQAQGFDIAITVDDDRIKRYHASNPERFTRPFTEVRDEIERILLGLARRRAFLHWLDTKTAELVRLAPGYEHPGDPSQPDNTHRH